MLSLFSWQRGLPPPPLKQATCSFSSVHLSILEDLPHYLKAITQEEAHKNLLLWVAVVPELLTVWYAVLVTAGLDANIWCWIEVDGIDACLCFLRK